MAVTLLGIVIIVRLYADLLFYVGTSVDQPKITDRTSYECQSNKKQEPNLSWERTWDHNWQKMT